MNNWEETTLANICKPISETFDFTGKSKVIFLNTGDILDGRFLHNNLSLVEGLPGQAKKTIQLNDILFSEIRPKNKRCALVNFKDTSNYVVSTKLMVIRANQCITPQYLYLILTSKETLDYFQVLAESRSGTFPQITFDAVSHYKVNLPLFPEQKAIAHILGALDDKIELNRQMNETLEQIARMIFKSWFIDFEFPNKEGKPFKSSGGEMIDSKLGKIPKGWKTGTIKDCCLKIENGGTPSRSEPKYWQPEEIPWLTSGEVRQDVVISANNGISKLGFENSSAKMWEKGTTVVALYGATAGQVCYLAGSMCSNQACCGLTPLENMRLFNYLKISSSVRLFEQQARGSAQQNLSKQIVSELPVVIPDKNICKTFELYVHPVFEKWIMGMFESRTLVALWDALLPKLLSGEIRVKDAEEFLKERGL